MVQELAKCADTELSQNWVTLEMKEIWEVSLSCPDLNDARVLV